MNLEVIATILRSLAFVVLYFFISFGPGFIVGMLLANAIFGRGKPTIMQVYIDRKKDAAQHNAQWNPSHPRWRE
ncbi:MAG: hypothetical protein U1C49_01005 [Candidatus Andersenbacteria bacterium]|nr:hypothetical protein [bacterium]MDZ4225405.1 hypothetical protein [Candidatus Andersenbacteria bacterium]